MRWLLGVAVGAFALTGLAGVARADDMSDVKKELDSLKRKVRELEGSSLTQDEVNTAVGRYFANAPQAVLVGGADEGKAGWPKGKKPYIKEGPNKLEIGLRYQLRYSAMLYDDQAVGVVQENFDPARTGDEDVISDAAPRDRSGFELERMYLIFEGTIFCEDISYKLELNFDTDSGAGVEKNYAYLDWKYTGEHHVRAGSDKTAYGYEENNSSSALAFIDRDIVTKGFELGFQTGVSLWGYFGGCECPKRFMYKFQAGNGEGRQNQEGGSPGQTNQASSPYNRDARDTFSDQLLFAAMLEWNITCEEWKWDEVDNRPCDKRCKLLASFGVSAAYENDDDDQHAAWGGLALRSTGRAERTNYNAWFRSAWNGWTFLLDGYMREVDYTNDNPAPTQTDYGAQALIHYRFADTNWGIGARVGMIWKDDDYDTFTAASLRRRGDPAATQATVSFPDTITEVGVVVNYFFWDHNNKIQIDANWIEDNTGVNSSSAGYMWGLARGVLNESGIMVRAQWQINF